MKKTFDTEDEANQFVDDLTAESKYAISAVADKDNKFTINWIEHKEYISYEGQQLLDEVWVKADGSIMLVQDIELDHAREIIRMLLRQQRQLRESIQTVSADDLLATLIDFAGAGNDKESDDTGESSTLPPGTLLH